MVDIGVKNIIIILIDLLVRDKMSISNQLTTDILFSNVSNHVSVLKENKEILFQIIMSSVIYNNLFRR